MIHRELFERLGGLDEQFFMYCEDGDFCLRARQAGKTTVLLPAAKVIHVGGASTPAAAFRLNGMISEHLINSRYIYSIKHFGYGAANALRMAYVLAGLSFIALGILLPVRKGRAKVLKHGLLLLKTKICLAERDL